MSTIQVQIPKPIQEVINILRTTDVYQITGPYFDKKGGCCAVGAIRVGFGADDKYGNFHSLAGFNKYFEASEIWYDHIKRHGGENWVRMNELRRMSFKEIADTIEKSYMEHGL